MRHCDMEKWAGYFVQQDILRDLIVEVLLGAVLRRSSACQRLIYCGSSDQPLRLAHGRESLRYPGTLFDIQRRGMENSAARD